MAAKDFDSNGKSVNCISISFPSSPSARRRVLTASLSSASPVNNPSFCLAEAASESGLFWCTDG